MSSAMVYVVEDLIYAFISDDLGQVVTSVCILGACIALFRVLRRGAGG